jgi:predicted outer membrane lipoprotein
MIHIIATCSQVGIYLAIAYCFVRGLWLNLVDFGDMEFKASQHRH